MARSCIKCDRPDNNEMVACDDCKAWFHYDCVGESPGVETRDFSCEKCIAKKEKKSKKAGKSDTTKPTKPTLPQNVTNSSSSGRDPNLELHSKEPDQKSAGEVQIICVDDDGKSTLSNDDKSAESRLQEQFRRMEADLARKELQLAEEKAIREKRLEIERILAEKVFQQERELQEKQLAQEKVLLERKLARDVEFQQQQRTLREEFSKIREITLTQFEEGAVGGNPPGKYTVPKKDQNVNDWLNVQKQHQGAIPKRTENEYEHVHQQRSFDRDTPKRHPEILLTKQGNTSQLHLPIGASHVEEDTSSSSSDGGSKHQYSAASSFNMSRVSMHGPGPTRAQRAARQILSKKLPIFTGRSEEWPLFYSSFVNSTEACGFSEIENLIRLQECLKGPALESVRSRLLLPQAVPQVMETLRMLYGRPEQLIHTLLNKVRKSDSPRADRLETFIPFGMAVQELCDHLEAADLRDHLVNPILIQELVDKLPAATKREWVQFKRFSERVTLRTFAEFASVIVREVSEVTLVDSRIQTSNRVDKQKVKEKGFIHIHSGEPEVGHKPTREPTSPCRICKMDGHRLRNCEEFRKMNLTERVKLMERWKLCERCLNEHEGWCRFKITCNIGNCRLRHHPLVHRVGTIVRPDHQNAVTSTAAPHHAHVAMKMPVIFRIVPVTLYNGRRSVSTFAYLDEGSSMTLVEDGLTRELGASGVLQPLTLQWTGNVVRHESASECLSLSIAGEEAGKRFRLSDAHTVKKLYLPRQQINFQEVSDQYPHLQGLCPVDHVGEEPRILIGLNNIYLFAPLESRVGNANEPIAVRSRLGWTIYGPRGNVAAQGFLGCHEGRTNEELHDMMREYFTLEESGFSITAIPEPAADRRAREILQETTIRINGRFETGLLWKKDDFQFPRSFQMAFNRLCGLERRLKKNPVLDRAVRQQIEDYQTKQYAHKATSRELAAADPTKVWYLPLNVVLNPKKPGKVRLVGELGVRRTP